MKLGVQQKKLLHLIQLSQDPTYIYFFLSQGLRVRVEMGTNGEKVCMGVWLKFGMMPSIYGALMLLNLCGD